MWKHETVPPRLLGAAFGDPLGRRMGRAVVAGVAGLLAVLWGVFSWSTAQQFVLAHGAAVSNTATLAKLVEAWALSTLERVNYLAVSVDVDLDAGRAGRDLDVMLRRQHLADPRLFRVIEVLDRNGRRIATSHPEQPTDSARNFDSDAPPTTPSLIGLPRDVGDRTLIPVLRPLGPWSAAGVAGVVVEIDPDYFGGFSSDLGLPHGASIMLMRTDGPLLARNRPALGAVGRSYPGSPLWRAHEKLREGSFTETETDGVSRVVSYRTSPEFPIVVSIGFPTDAVYAEARRRTMVNGVIGAVLSVLLIVAARVSLNALRRRAAAERAAAIAVAAVESVGSGVAVVEIAGSQRIELANPAFGRLLRPGGDPSGRTLGDLAGPGVQALLERCALAGPDISETASEIRLGRGDGEPLWVEVRVAPIRDRMGFTRHAVVVMTDISERRRTADELVHSKEEAEEASRAKSEFLANMSHELRTPLNAVIGFSDMIANQVFGPVGSDRYREYAELIHASGQHLLDVISDILDLAKVEAKRVILDERAIVIDDVLTMCATLVASRAAEADVRVVIRTPPLLPQLSGDELRVKQIVINLLSNAVKFSAPASEVTLEASLGDDGGIEISVCDHGCGMTTEELALAIQPFRQVNSAIARRAEGTGLGLPLALRLAALHGGRVQIDSTPGMGTTARVQFPPSRTVRARAVA